ncbi:MAG: ankyrin repeat domain-containing protein [Acidobacteria bacterium]|nr:ankyrin repeat domain-containing protein [Acidobacteriota bacterium]
MTAFLLMLALLTGLPLIDAVKQQNKAAVRALLQKRVDVNVPAEDGATALHWAVYRDNTDLVDMLIAAGARVNVSNDLKVTPLALASANGNTGIVEKLLKAGADPDAADHTGVTPLMHAARAGSVGVVHALISHEAKVNVKERDRDQTALMWAVAQKHPDVVKALIEAKADIHARTKARTVRVMVDQGPRRVVKTAREDARDFEAGGATALLFAAQVGDVESARLLLAAGAKVNETSADGNAALPLAAFSGNGPVAQLLLEAGADPNAAGAGYTALHAAVLRSDLPTIKALIAKGANINAQIAKGTPVRRFGVQWTLPSTFIGGTPLFVAAAYLEAEIIRTLAAAGANHSIALPNGNTPLHVAAGIAVEKNNRPTDRVERTGDDEAPASPRSETRVFETTKALLDMGAGLNQVNEGGDTALHAAAAGGFTSVIQLLADKGAKLDIQNKAGKTPLTLATQPKVQDLLKKLGASN